MPIAALNKARILIVEDNPTNARMLARALLSDYKISIAGNGTEALEVATAEETRPDLILLDIMLPDLSGHQVCAQLKDQAHTRDIPVIFISAKDTVADEEAGLNLGAVDYIAKPFSLPIVKARIRTHVELKRHRDYFEKLSHHDGLTGVANRRRFDETAIREWRRCCRLGDPLTVIMIDIDEFKKYNDHLGHAEGDVCLKEVARALSEGVQRAGDFLARYGGEEFVVLLPQTNLQEGMSVANRLRERVAGLQLPHSRSAHGMVTVSIGVASRHVHRDTSLAVLMKQADQALYAAKEAGRNRVQEFCELQEPVIEREEGLAHLRKAIANRSLSAQDWANLGNLVEGLSQGN